MPRPSPQRSLKNIRESGKTAILSFTIEISEILKKAIVLKTQKSSMTDSDYTRKTRQIEKDFDQLLKQYASLADEDAARFIKRLNKQREHLLTFLYHDDVEPTNNHAERMLRPEVITRKTQRCNKTDAGARKHAVLGSILATLRQRKLPVLDFLEQLHSPLDPPPIILSGHT